MDTSQWPQIVEGGGTRRARPEKDETKHCPRCNSTNTKFCYYNNYSLSQPRYFCKTCRRYWTEGGSLRNVPVGGGSRKTKRPSSDDHTTSSKIIKLHDHHDQNPSTKIQGQDLNLAYPPSYDQNMGPFLCNNGFSPMIEEIKGFNLDYGGDNGNGARVLFPGGPTGGGFWGGVLGGEGGGAW